MTSRGGRVSGVPGAYWGANLKRVEQSSHLPSLGDMAVADLVSTYYASMDSYSNNLDDRLTISSGHV